MILPLLSAFAFFLGVLLAAFSSWSFASLMLLPTTILLLQKPRYGFLILCFLGGILRMQIYEHALNDSMQNAWTEVVGTVVEEVDQRRDEQKLTVRTMEGQRILVSASPYIDIQFGNVISAQGFLERPESGSYSNFLFRHRILYTMKASDLEKIQYATTSFRSLLYAFKDQLMSRIEHLYFEPEASLVAGLLLGSRKGMSEELTQAFQATGLTHIVAISGYNISLIIACIFALFSSLALKKRVVVSVVCVGLFVLFVGASAAAVRAGIMGSLSMWALYSGRRSQAFFILLWSAVLMTLWNPAILIFDIGFQLSFAATLGLLLFAPLLDSRIPLKPGFFKEALTLTLSAQITTTPFISFYFGRLSLISPFSNVLIAPFIPFAMLFSALSMVADFPFSLLASFFLKVIIGGTHKLAKLPFADIPFAISLELFCIFLLFIFLSSLVFYRFELVRAFGLGDVAILSKARGREFQKHEKQSRLPVSVGE